MKPHLIERFADELLLGIEDRGKHATGFVATTFAKEVKIDKSAITATEFIKDREKLPKGLQTLLLHTRYKTKGDPEIAGNNHPVIYKTCFAIHNGSISNDDELFKEEELQRNFEVDTEIIAALFDKYGLANEADLKKSLEKFQGAMATAVIDPINFPGKLLLAKGSATPLAILNTADFIVWASTTIAIREAWGKVFGTPPDHSKIKHLSEGKAWIVNGPEIEEFDFKVNRPLWQGGWRDSRVTSQPVTGAARGSNARTRIGAMRGGSRGSGSTKPWEGINSLFITERAFKEEVERYRRRAIGQTARIWSEREVYEPSDFDDVEGLHEWLPCLCGQSVLKQDMKFHLKYRSLCMDCQDVVTMTYRDRAARAKENSMPDLKGEDLASALKWGEIDGAAHAMVTDKLVEETSLTIASIDYFLYRSPEFEPSTPYGEVTRALKAWLQKRYKEIEADVWETHSDTLLEIESEESENKNPNYVAFQSIKDGIRHLWYRCSTHGIAFKHGEACHRCEGTNIMVGRRVPRFPCAECGEEFPRYQITTTDHGVHVCDDCLQGTADSCQVHPLRALPAGDTSTVIQNDMFGRCPTCKSWQPKAALSQCRVCESKPKIEVPNGCCGKTQKGRPCRRKVRFSIAGQGFCYNHWTFCHHKKCNDKAKHMNEDGVRYCHTHVRKTTGFRAETQWVRDGATILEVV